MSRRAREVRSRSNSIASLTPPRLRMRERTSTVLLKEDQEMLSASPLNVSLTSSQGSILLTPRSLLEDSTAASPGHPPAFVPPAKHRSDEDTPAISWDPIELPLLPLRVPRFLRSPVPDRWLLGALAVACTRPDLLQEVFPDGTTQRVRLFCDGEETFFEADNDLPYLGKRPLFCNSSPMLLWPAAIEKAFALHFGSYGALKGGSMASALMDVMGRPVQVRLFSEEAVRAAVIDNSLWATFDEPNRSFALAALTKGNPEKGNAGRGIYTLSAYPVVRTVPLPDGCYAIQLLDVWHSPFRGRFSKHWDGWTDELRELLKDDSEEPLLWMHSDDVAITFNTLFSVWLEYAHEVKIQGEWTGREGSRNAGGSLMFPETVCNNPQYSLHVAQDNTKILFTLSQPDIRKEVSPPVYPDGIGMYLLKPADESGLLPHLMLCEGDVLEQSGIYASRDVSMCCTLDAGHYTLMPCTFEAHRKLQYRLWAVSDQQFRLVNHDELPVERVERFGNWQNNSLGGVDSAKWHVQTQYRVVVGDSVTAQISLQSREPLEMALYIFESDRHVVYPHRLVARTGFLKSTRVGITLDTVFNRNYAVLPVTREKKGFSDFVLSVAAQKGVPLDIERLRSVWKEKTIEGAWNEDSAGGSHNEGDSWKRNPTTSLFVAEDCEAIIVLEKVDHTDGGIGIYCVRGDPPLETEKICGASRFLDGQYVATSFLLSPGDYSLVPCTFNAGKLGRWKMTIYLDGDGHFKSK